MKIKKVFIEFALFIVSIITFFFPWFSRHCQSNLDGGVFGVKEISCPPISGFNSIDRMENIMNISLNNASIYLYFAIIFINLIFFIYRKNSIQLYGPKILLVLFYLFVFTVNTYKYYEFNPFEGVLYGFYINIIFTFTYLFYNEKNNFSKVIDKKYGKHWNKN